ncbi:hypothetical protein [Methylobacterium sp. Leaf361]|uniref:hypothetical protein n=1 Tax=Methylobacterium sp. Leaf361 TaxID=1736352 RepID=UPI000B305041|nr:hypothetical protein [Methylobacterium sp. Leaf361]
MNIYRSPMIPKRLALTLHHNIGLPEARRRLDRRANWAFRDLARKNIIVEFDEWFGNRCGFTVGGYGQRGSGVIQVNEESLYVEALVPSIVWQFAPMIEAVGRYYAERLLSV